MNYEWDSAKRRSNLEKHGLDFSLAEMILSADSVADIIDDRFSYGEERHLAYAEVNETRLCLCYAKKQGDIIRIISLRRAHEKEWRKIKWQ